jgi:hypothetical protein
VNPRKCIVAGVVVALTLWGPLEHSWPAWLAIRLAYLVTVPVAVWFGLGYVWKIWRPDSAAENRLSRTLAGAVAGMLLVFAWLQLHRPYHFECTEYARSIDGQECVGDDVALPGPDWSVVLMLVVASGGAFWVSARRNEPM